MVKKACLGSWVFEFRVAGRKAHIAILPHYGDCDDCMGLYDDCCRQSEGLSTMKMYGKHKADEMQFGLMGICRE